MRTLLALASCAFLLSLPCSAQRRGAGGVTFVNPSGYGNVAFPGTGGPNASFPMRLGATVAGNPGLLNPANSGGPRRGAGGGGYAGAYPIFVGGAYVPAYAPDYSGQTQLAPQQPYAAAPPPVVINQYFGAPPSPAMEPVTAPTSSFYQPSVERRPEPADAPPPSRYYLLAFKDHSVYSALAYWIEDKTLHYVTPQNTHNQASLDLVDVAFTKQLNQDRDVPFTPQAQQPRQ